MMCRWGQFCVWSSITLLGTAALLVGVGVWFAPFDWRFSASFAAIAVWFASLSALDWVTHREQRTDT